MIFGRKKKKECNVILSAGGIRALAQIGALEALEEEGWTIKSICGISAGAIVASFYAFGVPLPLMRELSVKQNFINMKKWNLPKLNEGLFKFNGLGDWVCENTIDLPGSKYRCELNIASCSLTTGSKKIFTNPKKKEDLSLAIESTCSIPVIFKPIDIGNEKFADGALWSSAPVHFYEDSKLPTFVIYVQNSHTSMFDKFHKPIHTIYRVFEVFQINRLRGLKKRILKKPVCIIEPELGTISALAFKASETDRIKLIEGGKKSVLKTLKKGVFNESGAKIF